MNERKGMPRWLFALLVLIFTCLCLPACLLLAPSVISAAFAIAQNPPSVSMPVAAPEYSAPVVQEPGNSAPPQASCVLDKIATWSEASSSNPYRIEVGGHGVQQVDFYPRGVKAISYIVGAIAPSDTPAIWHGFGSAWEGQLPACANFDFVADATNYARARTDSGHSGLVIDLRGGNFTVVANVSNMTQDEINSLLALHKAAMDPTK